MATTERTLAVMTIWAWLGSFGFALVLTGFRVPDLALGLCGFALFLVAGSGHVIVNRLWGTGFGHGEVALGFVVYVVAVLVFLATWIAAPDFGVVRIALGLGGFAALFAALVLYLATSFGVRGSIALIDEARRRPLAETRRPRTGARP
jgi:hypothetical protein